MGSGGGVETNIEPSICPGCCIGCGLYLLESEGVESDEKRRKVMHRKMSVVNDGKLCRFGTNLHEYYYEREALSNSVGGKE